MGLIGPSFIVRPILIKSSKNVQKVHFHVYLPLITMATSSFLQYETMLTVEKLFVLLTFFEIAVYSYFKIRRRLVVPST